MRPIRTTSDNDFAHDTMVRRLPTNIRNIIASHEDYSSLIRTRLGDLADQIAGNTPIPRLRLPAWDAEYWNSVFARREGEHWHDTDWFFGETYAFRLILEATRYFETGIDPFGPMKEKELRSGAPFLPVSRFFSDGGPGSPLLSDNGRVADPRAVLVDAIHLCIWGNRADISFTAGGDLDHSDGERDLLLVDDAHHAAEHLLRTPVPQSRNNVHIVMDNSGAELAGDLVLATVLVALTGSVVVLHPKAYPTYVSDTIVADIHIWLQRAQSNTDPVVRRFAEMAENAFKRERIRIAPDRFWCETEFLTALPTRLTDLFRNSTAVIVKGDFNYRRATRDTIWEANTTIKSAMGLEQPQPPWLLLRTMKSDCLAGVPVETMGALDRSEPGWRTAGKHGIVQLAT